MTEPRFEDQVAVHSLDCVLQLDAAGLIQHANPSALCLMEVPEAEKLVGTRWLSWWEQPEGEAARKALVSVAQGHSASFTGFAYTLQRTPKWWDVHLHPYPGTGGQVLVVARDITELHLRKQQIQELNAWLEQRVEQRTQESMRANYQLNNALLEIRDLYDNAPCGYFTLDPQGRLVAANRTAQSWLDLKPEDVAQPRSFLQFLAPADQARFETWRSQVLTGQVVDDGEYSLQTARGGQFMALLQAKAIFDFQGRLQNCRFSMIDVTERHKAQRAMEHLNTELQSAVRQLGLANTELESFSYSVSHDLRAPLRRISQFAEMARDLLKAEGRYDGGDLAMPLDSVIESSKHMSQLIVGLLDFSRLGRKALQLIAVDMRAMVLEARKGLEVEAEGQSVVWQIAPDWPQVQADPILIREVWSNLLSNALKYSRHRDPAVIEIDWAPHGQTHWLFRVKDNGAGFPKHMKNKLFGVFQRLHSATEFEGNGIGLALTRRIVERHQGEIWADAEEGQGCTFCFTLPILNTVEESGNLP